MVKNKKHECPECGEILKSAKGVITNKTTGEKIHSLVCKECNQMYGLIDGEPAYYPADSKGTPTHHYCDTCGIDVPHKQRVVFVLREDLIYDQFCIDCGIEALRNSQLLPQDRRERITKENVMEMSDLQSFLMHNHVFETPELLRVAFNTPEMKEFGKKMGMTEDQLDERIEELARNPQQKVASTTTLHKTAEKLK